MTIRGPQTTRIWPRDSAADLRSWVLATPLALLVTAAAAVPPPTNYDQPNPQGPRHPVALRTHLQAVNLELVGQDKFFGLAGKPNFDQPNPRGPVGAVDLRTWLQSTSITLRVAAGTPPPANYDQPNPQPSRFAASLRTHLDPLKLELLGKDQFFGAPGQVPAYDQVLPPRGLAPSSALLSWFNAPSPPPAPFAQNDWPNPRGARPVQNWHQNASPLALLYQQPFAQTNWPNPRAPGPSTALRTWVVGNAGLLVPATPFHQLDWPNPRAPARPTELMTWTDGIAPLPATVPPGTPTVPVDQPNPRGRAWPRDPGYVFGYAPYFGLPVLRGTNYLAVAQPRQLVSQAGPRNLVALVVNNMSRVLDFQPPIDAVVESEFATFDFGLMLSTGVAVTSATIACSVYKGSDAAPQSRVLSSPGIIASPTTLAPASAVTVLVGNMVAGTTYRLLCVATTSDGQTPSAWNHIACQAPN